MPPRVPPHIQNQIVRLIVFLIVQWARQARDSSPAVATPRVNGFHPDRHNHRWSDRTRPHTASGVQHHRPHPAQGSSPTPWRAYLRHHCGCGSGCSARHNHRPRYAPQPLRSAGPGQGRWRRGPLRHAPCRRVSRGGGQGEGDNVVSFSRTRCCCCCCYRRTHRGHNCCIQCLHCSPAPGHCPGSGQVHLTIHKSRVFFGVHFLIYVQVKKNYLNVLH